LAAVAFHFPLFAELARDGDWSLALSIANNFMMVVEVVIVGVVSSQLGSIVAVGSVGGMMM